MKDIRWATRKQYPAEEKIRIVLEGLRGKYSFAELCRREGIAESLYYNWSKELLEVGKRRLNELQIQVLVGFGQIEFRQLLMGSCACATHPVMLGLDHVQ